jgi:hypothetical protein
MTCEVTFPYRLQRAWLGVGAGLGLGLGLGIAVRVE